MNVPYDLWPIWCDYLEEQGYETELLRYIMTWMPNTFYDCIQRYNDENGIGFIYDLSLYLFLSSNEYGDGDMPIACCDRRMVYTKGNGML